MMSMVYAAPLQVNVSMVFGSMPRQFLFHGARLDAPLLVVVLSEVVDVEFILSRVEVKRLSTRCS